MKSINKKLASIMFLFSILFSNLNVLLAKDITLEKTNEESTYHLQYWYEAKQAWYYIYQYSVTYRDPATNKVYPAFCLDYGVDGVGEVPSQTVNIDQILSDERVYRIVTSTYPYRTLGELGVETETDAYIATRQAIYSVLLGRNPSTFYRGATDRGVKIHNLLINLYNEGMYGTRTFSSPMGNIVKLKDIYLNGDYYEVLYKYEANNNVENYTVGKFEFPSNTLITDENNNVKNTFNYGENFKIRIPKQSLTYDINGQLIVDAQNKCYPIFYGRTYDSNLQNYAVAGDPYMPVSSTANLNIKSTVKITGQKTSNGNNIFTGHIIGQPVANAEYEIRNSNNELVTTVTTDKDGNFSAYLNIGTYTIRETKAPEYFKLDTTVHTFTIDNIFQNVNINLKEDVVEGGYLNFIKLSQDKSLQTGLESNSRLAGATYEIRSVDTNEVVKTVTTNSKGTLDEPIKLKLGKYSIKETKAPEGYQIDPTIKYFTIEKNEQKLTYDFFDSAVPMGIVHISKFTNDDNLWTEQVAGDLVAGATYEIYDIDGNVVSRFTTDKNGTTEPIILNTGRYTMKEVEAPKYYLLSDKEYVIRIKDNLQEINLEVENTPEICGLFNLTKKSYDNNLWNNKPKDSLLEGAVFEIKNIDTNEIITTVTTNSEGTLDEDVKLPKGNYSVREIKAPKDYYLDQTEYKFTVNKNKQIIHYDFTNKSVIGGYFNIEKTSSKYSEYTLLSEGSLLPNAKYVIKSDNAETGDELGEILESIEIEVTTDENGQIPESLLLHKGNYTIQEIDAPEHYLVDSNYYEFEISENEQNIVMDLKDDPVETKIKIEKTGIIQTQANEEIRYNFPTLQNNSNVSLDNFTWIDNIPYEYIKPTKLFTGIYNEDIDYKVLYKTNKQDYKEFGTYNTLKNNCIDFTNIELSEDEYITNFKLEFGTVKAGFKATTTPFLFTKVNSNVQADDTWINKTELFGYYLDYKIEDNDEWTTKVYEKKLKITKLPKTGM